MTDIINALLSSPAGFILLLLVLPPLLLRWLKQPSVTRCECRDALSVLMKEQQGLAREIAACRERIARLE